MASDDSTQPAKTCTKCGEEKPIEAFRAIKGKGRRPEARRAECKACAAQYDSAYHEAHPHVRQQLWHAYYGAKHEEMLLRVKTYYYKNQGDRTASHRAWTKAHPEKANVHTRKRKAAKLRLPSTFTDAERTFCRAYFNYACAVCGKEEGFQWIIGLDHWIPLKSPVCPGTVALNMIPLCHGKDGCNNKKGRKDPRQWLIEQFGTRKAAKILKKIEAYFAIVKARESCIQPT